MNNEHDPKLANAVPVTDPRIVYGGCCVWWDSIANAGTTPSGLPGCPRCGSPLFEVASALVWWTNVDSYAEREGDTEYRAFIEWLRGQCFPTVSIARTAFQLERMSRKDFEMHWRKR